MSIIERASKTGIVASIVAASVFLTVAPAQAATTTWFSGDGCHNVWRNESGGSTSQSRTGTRGEGGSTAGLSQITVYHGTAYTQQWAGSAEVNSPRGYAKGKFKVDWAGGKNGECAGRSYGRALNVGAPGMAAPADDSLTSVSRAARSDIEAEAFEKKNDDSVVLSVEQDGFTFSATFSNSQVESGAATMTFGTNENEAHTVSFDPSSATQIEITE